MRQILYVSLSTAPEDAADLDGILHQSRHNNAIDGITGLLWSDGRCFLQAFEGPRASVTATFDRICADPRHHSLRILLDRRVTAREFGTWNMTHRRAGEPIAAYESEIRRLLRNVSDEVRAPFNSLIENGSVTAHLAER